MAEVSLNAMLYHDRRSARCGIGLDGDGEVSILKLQPYIDVSSVFQRVVSDARIVRPLEAIMGDEAVLMPEKSKLNYKQRLAEGGELFGLGGSEGNGATGNTALSNRTPSEFGRFPIRKCSRSLCVSRSQPHVCSRHRQRLRVLPEATLPAHGADEPRRARRLHGGHGPSGPLARHPPRAHRARPARARTAGPAAVLARRDREDRS